MSSELLPCPFCGGESHFEIDTDGSFMLEVEHESWCFLTSMDTRRWYYCETAEEAAEDWNTRAERTCKGCVYDLPNGMSADLCLICVRNSPDMYKKVVE